MKRKKSLPEVQGLPVNIMSREEAAVLSSAQRHEFRRQAEEAELYRANPLLYLTSPAVQVSFGPRASGSDPSRSCRSGELRSRDPGPQVQTRPDPEVQLRFK